MPINGVFGLTNFYQRKVENSLTQVNSLWSEGSAGYGYFSQGITTPTAASAATNITRIEDTTGTTSNRPTIFSTGKYERNALTSQYYAYFCCGFNPAGNLITTIDRLDYSNETLSTTPEVAPPRVSQARSSTSEYGYVAGGSPGAVSTISRLAFSVETFSTPGFSNLPAAREKVGVTQSYYGAHYIAGSAANSVYSRLDFTTEVCGTRPSVFPQLVIGSAGISNRLFGYYAGGSAPPLVPIYQSSITKLDFTTESFSTSPQVLTQRKNDLAGVSLGKFGYFGGGYFTPVAVHYSTVERFDFETEVRSTPGNTLGAGASRLTGIEGGYTKKTFYQPFVSINPVSGLQFTTYRNKSGYFAGGGPEYISTVSKIEFTDETVSNVATLPSGISSNDAIQSNSYAYIGGGLTADSPAYTFTSNFIRYEYVGDTVSIIPTKLPSARFELAGVSALGYGYFAGGIISPVPSRAYDATSFISSIVRFEFNNETTRTYNKNLPEVAAYSTGVSSGSYGYFVGGITQTSFASTSITRIDFLSDILVTQIPSTLPVGRKNMSKLDSGLYGYFIGGEDSSNALVTTISRIDFSTDTVSSPTTLGTAKSQVGTASARENGFGYIAGGTPLNNGFEKFSFTTETRSPMPATFSTNRNNMTCFESVVN